jgi:hypothetical protein
MVLGMAGVGDLAVALTRRMHRIVRLVCDDLTFDEKISA